MKRPVYSGDRCSGFESQLCHLTSSEILSKILKSSVSMVSNVKIRIIHNCENSVN